MANQVSVLDKLGIVTYYSSYTSAKDAILNTPIPHPLIQIWANLTEQIVLFDGADIWIAPGVEINLSTDNPTITDNGNPCNCKIYGYGIIKNLNSSSSSTNNYACKFTNANSKISIECNLIQNKSSTRETIQSYASEFNLKCNGVVSEGFTALWLYNNSSKINIEVSNIETGLKTNTNTGSTAMISKGNGFIKIDKVLCNNLGHCLSHRGGELLARIRNMTTVMNQSIFGFISTIHLSSNQGSLGQKLILYFDEINCLNGTVNNALCGIEVSLGTGIFIGRRVYSEIKNTTMGGAAIQISGSGTKGFVECNEIISKDKSALVLNEFTDQITIISNYMEGPGEGGVVFTSGAANFVIKNAKIKNTYTGSSYAQEGIFIFGGQQNITLRDIKIISGNATSGHTMSYNGGSGTFSLDNYGIFVKREIDSDINLDIGPKSGTDYNFLYIVSLDL